MLNNTIHNLALLLYVVGLFISYRFYNIVSKKLIGIIFPIIYWTYLTVLFRYNIDNKTIKQSLISYLIFTVILFIIRVKDRKRTWFFISKKIINTPCCYTWDS